MQGRALAGPAKAAPHEFVFITRDRMDERYDMMRSAMDSRWLYIRNYRPDLPYVQPLAYKFQARGYQSWAAMARRGKTHAGDRDVLGRKADRRTLRHAADPDSVHNLAGDPRTTRDSQRMRAALRALDAGKQGQRFHARGLGAGRLRRLAPRGGLSHRAGLRPGQPGLRGAIRPTCRS